MKTHRLLQLIRDNVNAPRPALRADITADGEATIYLYDIIDAYWGVAAADFAKALGAITAPTIHLRINSPGGDVFEARAIVAAMAAHPSTIIAHVDGYAASAATIVAVNADEVRMQDGAFFMIHNAWALGMGNAQELRTLAALLDKADASIVADYMRKTAQAEATIKDWMAAETWFTAAEALDAGFVNAIDEAAKANGGTAQALGAWDVSAYEKAPRAKGVAIDNAIQQHRAALERRLVLFERTAA